MKLLSFILLSFALLTAGVLGTETRLLFFWPACVVLGLAGVVAGARWTLRVSFPPSDLCLVSVIALAGYFGARAWLSPVAGYAREDLFVICGCFVAYVLTITAASHPRWRLGLAWVLLVLAVGNMAVGFIHFSGRWSFHVVPEFVRTFGDGRIGGFFNNPNHLAAFFSFVVFLCAGILCFGRGCASWKLLLGFFVIAFSIGMSLTISRGALIGLLAGGLVFAALSLWIVWETQRHLFVRIVIAAAGLIVLGGGVLYKVNEEFLRRRMTSLPACTDVREHVWRAAIAQHQDSTQPWFGDGARSFYDGCYKHRPAEMPGWTADALFAHNEYLQTLVDYGWLGLVLVAWVAVAHLGNGLRFLHWFAEWKFPMGGLMTSNSLALAVGSVAALVASMVHAVFEFHWHVAVIAIIGSVLLGILANPGFEGPHHKPVRIPGARLVAKLGMIAASLAMIVGAATIGRADYFAAKAEIAARDSDPFKQIQALSRSIEIDPRNGETWYRRGLAWLDQVIETKSAAANRKALEKAAGDLERAVKLNPNIFLYPLALADAYDGLGRHDEARQMIERSLAAAPNHEEPRLALAIHWHRLKNWAEAERAYLWASRAPAANINGAMRWNDGYFQMLKHAAGEAEAKAAKAEAPRVSAAPTN